MKKITAVLAFIIAFVLFSYQIINEKKQEHLSTETPTVVENIESNSDLNMSKKDAIGKIVSILVHMDKTYSLILIVGAIAIYIIAWLLSMGDKCTIVYTWWDMMLLLICGGIFWFYFMDSSETINNQVLVIIVAVSLIISAILSFVANIKNPFPLNILFSIVSILTKIILIVFVPMIVFMILNSFSSGKKDKRYKDGTKENEKTAIVTFVFLILGIIVAPLVKTNRKNNLSDSIENFSDEKYTKRFLYKWNRILYRNQYKN